MEIRPLSKISMRPNNWDIMILQYNLLYKFIALSCGTLSESIADRFANKKTRLKQQIRGALEIWSELVAHTKELIAS